MDLYIAICEDRHEDIDVRVFSTEEKAIDYAQDFIPDRYTIEEQKLTPGMINEGWIYYAKYGPEGDCVRVETGFLDDDR